MSWRPPRAARPAPRRHAAPLRRRPRRRRAGRRGEGFWAACSTPARRRLVVELHEMRPVRPTPVHHTSDLAELVCSNSLKSNLLDTASGLLKEEMRRLDSLIVQVADRVKVPAGGALAVDREAFARGVTDAIAAQPNIRLVREEVTAIPGQGPCVLATGP